MQWLVEKSDTIEVTAAKRNEFGRYALFANGTPIGYGGNDTDNKQKARSWLNRHAPERIAARWVRKLGLGFHPDTRGDDYSPTLSAAQIKAYEQDMRFLFKWAADPYAVGLAAMKKQNLLSTDTPPCKMFAAKQKRA